MSDIADKLRLLGLVFSSADLAFEVEADGAIAFAVGAVEKLTGRSAADIQGLHWCELVSAEEEPLLAALAREIRPGERRGPFRVHLRRPDGGAQPAALLTVFQLPQTPDCLSATLALAPPTTDKDRLSPNGFLERSAFEEGLPALFADVGEAAAPARLALVQLDGIAEALTALDAVGAQRTLRQIGAALRIESHAGMPASEIADGRFAFVPRREATQARVSERLEALCMEGVRPTTAELVVDTAAPEQSLRTVRYALDQCIERGVAEVASEFQLMLAQTAQETASFRTAVADDTFRLVYQPVVSLDGRATHHFEALTRFEGAESPAAAIHMAEEVGMIADFDLAVAKKVVAALSKAPPEVRIAANVSAASLLNPAFVQGLTGLTAQLPKLRPRLLLELTETQKLKDLVLANAVFAELRAMGHAICLDDFGAGASSLEYLSRLDVDYVKFDGRYILALDRRPRDKAILKHVVALCAELKVSTIAEMVETEEVASALKGLGIVFGQGWLFGRPEPQPMVARPAAMRPALARRKGASEEWR